ncbi:MAG: ubiquinol-cytochrome c reductase iron-sulfur subunit [Candidatus Acidiferrum sp.]|jgi:menaquinol-cytochrome c reductase iron-sulfur subunit
MWASRGESATPPQRFEADGTPIRSRRSFLGVLLGVGSALIGGLLAVPLIRFAIFPLIRRTTDVKNSPLGPLSDFSSLPEPVMRTIQIESVDGWRKAISEKAVYVTTDRQGQLRVLSSICPHLGCTVPWNKDRKQFVCPCHGGTYMPDGTYVSGPALRGMDSLENSVENGQLTVRFQYFRQLVSDKEVIG